ncbi:MAG: SusC/RagA family TonB-linked outer membrane protein [Flavipsychrobacter sp.]|nr:SusC/RagA family TonB-linked outer membrane protein [Flavipsychrobacter sp.]
MKRLCLLLALLITVGITAFAQNTHTVTGKVLDENGNGFPGAGITLRGTQIGTVTDANGDFMLDVPDGDNLFIIQAVGYGTMTVKENEQGITVRLRRKSKELEGTVVTAQAVRREKRELGYNSTTVSAEDLTAGNNVSSLSALAGKVPGVNITSSTGGPGGSTRIIARGENSILKNNNMLIVVDGVIMNNRDRTKTDELEQVDFGNTAQDINPEEIESMSILQGARGSVLYGSLGANGVIMITTKSGKRRDADKPGKMDITYKAMYTQSDILKYADMQHTYGQGNIYQGVPDDRRENFSWGYKFDGQMRPWGQVINGKQMVKPYSDQPNNIRNFFDHGRNLTNYLSVSGGNETSTYFLSLGAVNSTGVVPNTFYNRYNVRFNGTTQLSNHFYSSVDVNYINAYSRVEAGGQNSGSVLDQLYQTPRDIPVQELNQLNNNFYSMQYNDTGGVERYGYYGGYYKNPYWIAEHYDNRNKSDQILGDVKVGYKCGEFNVFDRVGVNVNSDRSYYKIPQIDAQPVDPFYSGLNYINPGGFEQKNYNGFRLYNDLIGTWDHPLTDNFGMNVLLGHNVSIFTDETLSDKIDPGTNGLVLSNFYNFTNNRGPVFAENELIRRRTFAFYGDFNFNFRREVYLNITGRNDWSSALKRGDNSYFYPGIAASWVFTERLKNTGFRENFLNYGKVRAGVSGVGSDAIAYANNPAGFTQRPVNSSFGSIVTPFNGVPTYSIRNVFGDANLKPERTTEFEVGTDLSFFKDRISFSFTYYNRRTKNLITAIPLAPSTGFLFEYVNIGDVTNKGEEYSLRATPIATRYGLRWDVFGTYTHNVNRVESLNSGLDHVVIGGYEGMAIVAAKGKPFGTFYAADIEYWNGRPVVDATTGLPIATAKPVYRGSYQPKFIASWGTDVSYKGLRLHALFTCKQGGQFYSHNKFNMDFNGTSPASTVNNRNPFVLPNSVNRIGNTNNYVDNKTAMSPYEYYTNVQGNNLPAQGLVNAGYVRLQELALSYAIPQKYYKRSPFGLLEAGIFGNNLLLWTAESNTYGDPEQTSAGATGNGQGFNYVARPSLRNYGAYLKVTF